MNITPIERLTMLLKQIEIQAVEVDQLNMKKKTHTLIENDNVFSIALFMTKSNHLTPYVKEVKQKIVELERLYKNNKTEYSKQSLEKIEQQISALLNALRSNRSMPKAASLSLKANKKVRFKSIKESVSKKAVERITSSSHQLYQKLSEHHEFERRLMNMLSEKDRLRTRSNTAENKKLSLEVLTLHQRLGRCRKAISAIEKDIAFIESKHL